MPASEGVGRRSVPASEVNGQGSVPTSEEGLPARILELGDWGMRPARWDELEVVGHWRSFLHEPGSYFRHLLDGRGPV